MGRIVIGLMTGTSMDALDGAAVRIDGRGLDLRATLLATATADLGALAAPLRDLASGKAMTARDIVQLRDALSDLHGLLAVDLVSELDLEGEVDLVAAHGQTVFHDPPGSWQMLNPARVWAKVRCPVVSDLRAVDLALGGQGAPITPLADWVLFRDAGQRLGIGGPAASSHPVAVVNLGGFCNVTLLGDDIRGMDVCACNQVLDHVARRALGSDFDKDGAAASRGTPHPAALAELKASLTAQSAGRRSLGTGDEGAAWCDKWAGAMTGPDLARTASEAIGTTIAQKLRGCAIALVAGGGAKNASLLDTLRRALHPAPVRPTDDLGIPISYREAVEIAILGALCADGFPITLPTVTGVQTPAIGGVWTGIRR